MASLNLRTHGGDWSGQFTTESIQTALLFHLEPDADDAVAPTLEEVIDTIKSFLGYTDCTPGVGHVKRVLPSAHPIYKNAVAVNVAASPVENEPNFIVEAADIDDLLEAAPFEDAVAWGSWKFLVTYGLRPFAMLRDDSLVRVDGTWTDESGDTGVSYSTWQEWLRYTEVTYLPREEYIKARGGELQFRRQGGAAPDETPFVDFPRILLPDEVMILKWYQVPYRFVNSINSAIRRYRNYVNQKEFMGNAPGTLLYRTHKERPYNPPFPDIDEEYGGLGVYSTEKLCDIEFEFWLTRRTVIDPPTPSNGNWIAAGWNAFANLRFGSPGSGGGFFYVSSADADPTKQYPFFNSFPFELLFNDPDA